MIIPQPLDKRHRTCHTTIVPHTDHMITVSREFVTELNECVEDVIEYTIREYAERGELISGETAWKIITCYAEAKIEEMNGKFN